MKTQSQKVEQLNRMIMNILTSSNNSVQNAVRWARLIKAREVIKNEL